MVREAVHVYVYDNLEDFETSLESTIYDVRKGTFEGVPCEIVDIKYQTAMAWNPERTEMETAFSALVIYDFEPKE